MKHAIDERPVEEGLYAAEIHFGWKLLEWRADSWWHVVLVGRWMADDPIQWIGPFPSLLRKPQSAMPDINAASQYDL